MTHDTITPAKTNGAREPAQAAGPERVVRDRALERWCQRFLRQLDLLESEARHLPPVNRQAALTRIAALRTGFLAWEPRSRP